MAKPENSFLLIPTRDLVNLESFRKRLFRKMSVLDEFDVLLDVVLGHGSAPDPASELAAVTKRACESVAIVCSITGTDQDPQNRGQVEMILKDAGAIVMPSNAAVSMLAGNLARLRGRTDGRQ